MLTKVDTNAALTYFRDYVRGSVICDHMPQNRLHDACLEMFVVCSQSLPDHYDYRFGWGGKSKVGFDWLIAEIVAYLRVDSANIVLFEDPCGTPTDPGLTDGAAGPAWFHHNRVLWPNRKPCWLDLTFLTAPFEMDVTFLTGPFEGAKCQGIYGWGGVDGQSLMIAIQDPGSDASRPTKFHMNGAVKTGLWILRPSKPSDTEREIGGFQGTWTLRNFDTGNFDKNKDPSSWPLPGGKGPDKSGDGSELRWVVNQNEITWTSRSGQEIKASFTIDQFQTPKQIDLTFLSGPHGPRVGEGETAGRRREAVQSMPIPVFNSQNYAV